MNREVIAQRLETLRAVLKLFPKEVPEKVNPRLHDACREAIVCKIEALEQQLREAS